jgi:hypothetical protein
MAVAKRHYSTGLPETQAAEFEALAAQLGLSIAEALRRAVTVFVAVTPPSAAPAREEEDPSVAEAVEAVLAQEDKPDPFPVPFPVETVTAVTEPRKIPVYRRIHKRKTSPGRYLEVWQRKRDGTYYYQFSWRDPQTNKKHSAGAGLFQEHEDAARARDATARDIVARLGILDEPMNFPRPGEVSARTGLKVPA